MGQSTKIKITRSVLIMEFMKNSCGVEYVKYTNNEILAGRGNKEFVNELAKNTRGYVLDVIRTVYLDSSYSQDDKLQLGYEGLLKAIKKFNPANGADFYTYAYISIQGVLYNESQKGKRAKRGYNKDENTGAKMISLDLCPAGDEGEGNSLKDSLVDNTVDVAREILNNEKDLVETIAKITGEKVANMLILNVVHGMTCEEVAQQYGVSKMAVSKNIRKGITKLRERYSEGEFAELIGLR